MKNLCLLAAFAMAITGCQSAPNPDGRAAAANPQQMPGCQAPECCVLYTFSGQPYRAACPTDEKSVRAPES